MPLSADDQEFIKENAPNAASVSTLSPDDQAFVKENTSLVAPGAGQPQNEAEWLAKHPARADAIEPSDAVLGLLAPELGADWLAAKGLMGLARSLGSEAVGKFLTGTGGKTLLGKLASRGVAGAGQGLIANQIERAGGNETPLGNAGSAAAGAGINALTGLVAGPFANAISPRVAQLAQRFAAAGVPVRTGQLPGASFASRLVGKLTGMSKPDAQALTQEAIASMGHSGDTLDGPTVDAAQNALSARFKQFAAQVPGPIDDPQLRQDLAGIAMKAHTGLAGDDTAYKKVAGALRQIYGAVTGGDLTGETYTNLTQKGSALSNLQSGGSPVAQYASATRNALDDALERAAPQQAADIQLARNQWRNSVILDNLKDKATDAEGLLDPKKLSSSVIGNYGGYQEAGNAAANVGNPVDLGLLAEGGKRFVQQPVTHLSTPSLMGLGAAAGASMVGGEAEGLPLVETLLHHPAISFGLGGSALGAGLLQNTQGYTNWLLARAARGAGPLLGGVNPLVSGYIGSTSSPQSGPTRQSAAVADYIQQAARARGMDPSVALRVAQSEGLGAYVGDQGSSFGPFQLHYGNVPGTSKGNAVSGLGDVFTARTGLDARDPSTIPAQIDFALDYARVHGWGPWHGWQGDQFAGIPRVQALPVQAGGVTVTPTPEWVQPQEGAQ